MRIHYMSDLHLEFGALDKPLPKGEVIVLAGDITLLATLDPAKTDESARQVRDATLRLFEEAARNFDRVVYLMGNHEHYGFCIDDSEATIRRHLPDVLLLENGRVDLGDAILCGATLWTDMGGGDPVAELAVQRAMSDFYVIETRERGRVRTLRPADLRPRFAASLDHIGRLADENPARKLVVATHHAPSLLGVAPQQRASRINTAYYTDLHDFIEARPNIAAWIHGHTHVQTEYDIGRCRVRSNARGYMGRERAAESFEPDTWFET
jgi:predicted phosphohydrolase